MEIGVKNQFSYQYKSKRHQCFTGVFFDIKQFINKYWLQKHVYIWFQIIIVFIKIFSLHLLMNLVNLKLLNLADVFSLALTQGSNS